MKDNRSREESSTIYEVKFEEREDYLYVSVRGPEEILSESLKVWKDIAQQCKDKGYTTVLIAEDVDTQLSIMDLYTFAAELPEIGFIGIAIAHVNRRIDQHKNSLFAETVGINRGLNGKVFNNMDDAIKWLLQRKQDKKGMDSASWRTMNNLL